jgi:succinate dehydrogenase / fumarate reductase iron-sulfur subunit
MKEAVFQVYRGDAKAGRLQEYRVEVEEGMVVLDAIHRIQAKDAPDLAVRWNCKAAKCGSCSAEVNGKPKLMCKTRLDDLPLEEPVVVKPMKTFPVVKDLVCDVSWNYEVNKKIPKFTPRKDREWRWMQEDIDRVQEYRKTPRFAGPRFLVRVAGLETHPMDGGNRTKLLKDDLGIGYCNITKCCTEVCPEDIHITDNAIIPLKERVVDEHYDPVMKVIRLFAGSNKKEG